MKELILDRFRDSLKDFLYYNRKEDPNLSSEDIKIALKNGYIKIDDMIDELRIRLHEIIG